jgi:hypothetical protein
MNAKEIQNLFTTDTNLRITPTKIVHNTDVGHDVISDFEIRQTYSTTKKYYIRTENSKDVYGNFFYEGLKMHRGATQTQYYHINTPAFKWEICYQVDSQRNSVENIHVRAQGKSDANVFYSANVIDRQVLGSPEYTETYEDVNDAQESFLRKVWGNKRFLNAAYKALHHMDDKLIESIKRSCIQAMWDDRSIVSLNIGYKTLMNCGTKQPPYETYVLNIADRRYVEFATYEDAMDFMKVIAQPIHFLLGLGDDIDAIIRPFNLITLNDEWVKGEFHNSTKSAIYTKDSKNQYTARIGVNWFTYVFETDAQNDANIYNKIYAINTPAYGF